MVITNSKLISKYGKKLKFVHWSYLFRVNDCLVKIKITYRHKISHISHCKFSIKRSITTLFHNFFTNLLVSNQRAFLYIHCPSSIPSKPFSIPHLRVWCVKHYILLFKSFCVSILNNSCVHLYI